MLRFRPCGCPSQEMERVHRSAWMRLVFPSHALYQCRRCRNEFLASTAVQTEIALRAFHERAMGNGGTAPGGATLSVQGIVGARPSFTPPPA